MARGSVEDYRPQHPVDQQYFSEDDLEAIIQAAGGLPGSDVDHQRAAEYGSTLIMVRVPRRVALKERLEDAARYCDIKRQYENKPTSMQTAETFKAIEDLTNRIFIKLRLDKHDYDDDVLEKLSRALRDGFEDEAQEDAGAAFVSEELVNGQFTRNVDILQPNGADLLFGAIKGIYRLRGWSRALSTRMPDATPYTERHEGDSCLDELFQHLARIWMDIFKGELRTSVGAPDRADEGKATGPLVRFFRACLEALLHEQAPTNDAIRARIRRLLPSLVKPS